jgi:quinoprotein glucose dehydrogenase
MNLVMQAIRVTVLLISCWLIITCSETKTNIIHSSSSEKIVDWKYYRGDDGVNAYSPLGQINKTNVKNLKVAWTYRSGDDSEFSKIECNPIIVDTILYGISAKLKVFALDAVTGNEIWVYDPFKGSKESGFNRGLTLWQEGNEKRIFVCAGYRLIAIDALTGKTFNDFGENGFVDLRKGIRDDSQIEKYDVINTSPGVVYQNLIIVGSAVKENYEALPGDIRAYDVRTGEMKWKFHTIPLPGEFGYETWSTDSYQKLGGANAWAGLSLDRNKGLVFASTGAPAFDFYGGERVGENLFANSIIALDAATGKYKWHFQTSHHDVWDYDLPSPPNLITIDKDGQFIDAVVQITKQGLIFVLDRDTGTPVFPIEERPVPSSIVPGEKMWPTQPFPLKYRPLVRTSFDDSIITNVSKESYDFIKKEVTNYTWGPIYTPPTTQGIIQMPGFRGGGEWSGAAIDLKTNIMYLPLNDIPNVVQLVEENQEQINITGKSVIEVGTQIYNMQCSACHGQDRKGNSEFPSLTEIDKKLKPEDVMQIFSQGRGKMPSFPNLTKEQQEAIVSFLYNINKNKIYKGKELDFSPSASVRRYRIKGYTQLRDQFGYPGVTPPWGMLCALDLTSGDVKWKIPLGEFPELTKKGIKITGTQLFGGAVVTDGGLVFIGASQDEMFRAFDKDTGELLWEYKLPVGGYATPSIYEIEGKQYIVIAAGGGGFQRTKTGDYYIAFALP